jgi:adenosylmethionine-8-amino-7-oxononanoate aminotransferase
MAPGNLEHVFFSRDGSSAVEVALKMAVQSWRQSERPQPQKTKFLALGEAYHGDTIGSASVGGIPRFHALFKPLLFDVVRALLPDSRRLPRGASPEVATAYFLHELERLLLEHHSAAGMVMHPPGYLRGVRALTKRYDVHLIADEVAVGFGRTGTMFACQQEDVVPDFLCLGKGLTGGYLPMAATITHSDIYNAFLGPFHTARTLHHGHTYSGNPLAAAAALASLDVFDEEQTLARLPPKIKRLEEHLCKLAEHPHVATTRQRGLIGALELTPDKSTGQPYPSEERRAWRICKDTLRHGVWLRPLAEVLYVMPPLATSLDEIDFIMNNLAAAIDANTD